MPIIIRRNNINEPSSDNYRMRGGTTKQSHCRTVLPSELDYVELKFASFPAMTVVNFLNHKSLILVLKSLKSYYIFFTISIILITSCSPKITYDKVRKAPKHGLITPPGTVWLKDSLFMDKFEVPNGEYIWWLRHNGKNQNLPDTNTWNDAPMIKYYFRHPAYSYYPVVGVSYQQAIEFCEWKTKDVNQNLHTQVNKKFKKLRYQYLDSIFDVPQYIKYRLPTNEEWQYAAQAGLDSNKYPYGYEKLYDQNRPASMTLEYYLLMKSPSIDRPIPSSNDFGRPNKYGIYNMLGNVSEMVNDSIVKGLNYRALLSGYQYGFINHNAYNPLFTYNTYSSIYNTPNIITSRFNFTNPTNYIGFRCICEVLKNP